MIYDESEHPSIMPNRKTDESEKPPLDPILEKALKYWAADQEGCSVLEIYDVEFSFDPGWGGTDVTPGDPPEFVISYTVKRDPKHGVKRISIDNVDVGRFIGEIADTSRRVNR